MPLLRRYSRMPIPGLSDGTRFRNPAFNYHRRSQDSYHQPNWRSSSKTVSIFLNQEHSLRYSVLFLFARVPWEEWRATPAAVRPGDQERVGELVGRWYVWSISWCSLLMLVERFNKEVEGVKGTDVGITTKVDVDDTLTSHSILLLSFDVIIKSH